MEFVGTCSELFEGILRGVQPVTVTSMNELNAATSILYCLASHKQLLHEKVFLVLQVVGIDSMQLGPQALRLQTLMISLLARFADRDRWLSTLTPTTASERSRAAQKLDMKATRIDASSLLYSDAVVAATAACRNAVAFLRSVALSNSVESSRVIFSPSFAPIIGDAIPASPPLQILGVFIRACTQLLISSLRETDALSFRLAHANQSNSQLNSLLAARMREVTHLLCIHIVIV